MKKIVILVTLLLFSHNLWAKKFALLVGVNTINGNNHLYTDIDINIVRNMVKKYGFQVTTLTEEKATLTELRKAFKSFYHLKKDDVFLFYYTGHGAIMEGQEPNTQENFFALHTTSFKGKDTIVGGVLTDKEFSNHLHKINAKKISIIDACHSGTIYKSISNLNQPQVKSLISKGNNGIFKRGKNIKNFKAQKIENFINISAAKDNEQAENSPNGSVFTVALVKTIKNNPSISIKELEKKVRKETRTTAYGLAHKFDVNSIYSQLMGKFTPVLKVIPKAYNRLRVKDVFYKGGRFTLNSVFNALNRDIKKLKITTDKEKYGKGEVIVVNIKSDINNGYLYLFEKKGDKYTFLGEKKASKYSQFKDIYASTPYGSSIIYAVITKKRLTINNQSLKKDSIITEEYLGDNESLAQQISKERVRWGEVKIETENN